MNNVLSKLKDLKHKEIIIAVVAVIVMLIIYFSSFGGSSTKTTAAAIDTDDYCTRIRQQIENAISRVDGVGKTEVVINWSSGVEIVPAQNTTINGNSTTSQVVLSSGGPIVLKEIYPRAIGVLIVCEGGSNAKIKIDIIMAISTLMDISTDKVLVFGMSK
ncbi:MAG: hypothetical protein J1F36_03970 [Clostridiales bacterium]|nr:hypothetical protein [Clostridiales bacterium]